MDSIFTGLISGVVSSILTAILLFRFGGNDIDFSEEFTKASGKLTVDVFNRSIFQKAYDIQITAIGKTSEGKSFDKLSVRRPEVAFLSSYPSTLNKWTVIIPGGYEELSKKYSEIEIYVQAQSGWFGVKSFHQKAYKLA